MKRIYTLLAIFLISTELFALPVASQEKCMSRKNRLNIALANKNNSLSKMYQEIGKTDAQVFLFGEQHYLSDITTKYSEVISGLKDKHPSIDCLVLEVPDRKEELDAIEYLEASYPNGYHPGWLGGLTHYGVLSTAVGRGDISLFSKLPRSSWAKTILAGLEMNLKLIPIDNPRATVLYNYPEYSDYDRRSFSNLSEEERALFQNRAKEAGVWATSISGLNDRDIYMANKIKSLIDGGVCQKVVGLFGKAHLSSNKNQRKNLNDLLKDQLGSEKVVSLNFQYTGQNPLIGRDRISPGWEWESCDDHPRIPNKIKAIPGSTQILNEVPLYEEGPGVYQDFSYHLIFPLL